ncbi:hypothetical protein ACFOJF_01680 [Pseudocitrobacter faecalis]
MLASTTVPGWKGYTQKTASILEIITFALCAVTLLTALINNNLSMKLFNISGVLAILTLIIRGKTASLTGKACILPATILLIGIVDVIWYSMFKVDNSPFRATYHSYLNTAKIFLFGTFIVLLASTSKFKAKRMRCFISFTRCHSLFLAMPHGLNLMPVWRELISASARQQARPTPSC